VSLPATSRPGRTAAPRGANRAAFFVAVLIGAAVVGAAAPAILAPAFAASGPDPAELLPRKAAGYEAAGEDGTYTRDTLFDLIDGGAEVYRSFDVRKVVSRTYKRKDAPDIIADVFDMGSAEDAFGVYHHDRRDGRDAGYGRESESVPGALTLWKDRWFVSLVAIADTPESAAALDALGSAIDGRLPKRGDMPAIALLLPRVGLERASIAAFRDWTYLSTLYDLGADNILDLDTGTYGVLARYKTGDPGAPLVLLIARYPSRDRAAAALARFRAARLPGADAQGAATRPNGRWEAATQADQYIVVVLDAAARPDINGIAGGIAGRARESGAGRGHKED
jgi:hypothetical protein